MSFITYENDEYSIDERNCIIKNGSNLGYGNINFKVTSSKSTAKKESVISFICTLEPVWTKDDEKIPYSQYKNEENIELFLKQWVDSNLNNIKIMDNVCGVEINFNSIFDKKIVVRTTSMILNEIKTLNLKMGNL
jgi:hypothetical protein